MLRENGFEPDDMPDDEIKLYSRKIASGSATPEQVEAALEAIGITLDSKRFGELGQGDTRETRPNESWTNSTLGRVPLATAIPSSRKTTARPFWQREGLVYRALEKGGQSCRQRGSAG